MGPKALQPGQHIAILGQFHLRLGVGRLGAHSEDVEDKRRAVENFHLQGLLDIAHLLGRELIVEDDHTDLSVFLFLCLDIGSYFLELAFSHIRDAAGTAHPLGVALHGDSSCRVGQKLQLVEVFLGLGFVLLGSYQSHKNGGLSLDFRYYEFFHA